MRDISKDHSRALRVTGDDHLIGFPSVREMGELQERAARAVPAAVEENKDGCWLRYSDSASTWWAGATLLHGNPRSHQLARRIATAEAFYAAHGVPGRFHVCPACPPGLDAALAECTIRQGSEYVYLQAERTNAAALNLYRRAGFGELCTYHYRTAAPRALTSASRAGDPY